MNVDCLIRKRIWEVDCMSLDTAVAASFDWRELVNILQGSGHVLDLQRSESHLEFQAHSLIHECCHSENSISVRIEGLLNEWHKKAIAQIEHRTPAEVAEYVLGAGWKKKSSYAGLFWALGSDSREGCDCIRRRFHQRFQIFSARRLQP
jgi:hypothetical protein